ncbi:hypothetical protein EYC84_004401 [Monilinia fructicola]|uniref:Up-regulated during septation protein 1 domain-containing protein n=1 Tax=Monilinia fructicola TaxID=38448 RepID=A0A5M9K085_MONFR|nr:hypothetical protein EYC84_004401 [Monilinia fructicola]
MPSRGERDQLESRKRKSMASQDLGYEAFDGQGDDYRNDRRPVKDRKENRESRDSDYGVKERRAAGRRYDVQAPDTSIVSGRSNSDQIREADLEREASEKKCEDLAAELWSLEKRLIEPEHRLLKHTAGILQMTHKGPKTNPGEDTRQGGIPGKPGKMSLMREAFIGNWIPWICLLVLFGMNQTLETSSSEKSKEHMQLISTTEQKLEDLNSALREVIIKANPDASHKPVPRARTNSQGKPTEAGETLQDHLDYLEQGIATLDLEHSTARRKADELNASMEGTLEELNREVKGLLSPTHPELQEPPSNHGTANWFEGATELFPGCYCLGRRGTYKGG